MYILLFFISAAVNKNRAAILWVAGTLRQDVRGYRLNIQSKSDSHELLPFTQCLLQASAAK